MAFPKDSTDGPSRQNKSARGARKARDTEKRKARDRRPQLPQEYLEFEEYFDPTKNPYLEPSQFHKVYPLDAFYPVDPAP